MPYGVKASRDWKMAAMPKLLPLDYEQRHREKKLCAYCSMRRTNILKANMNNMCRHNTPEVADLQDQTATAYLPRTA